MSTFTNESKNSASFSNQSFGTSGDIIATAGQAMGVLGLTYAGGEILVAGSLPVFSNQSKNSATFTNQSKN